MISPRCYNLQNQAASEEKEKKKMPVNAKRSAVDGNENFDTPIAKRSAPSAGVVQVLSKRPRGKQYVACAKEGCQQEASTSSRHYQCKVCSR